MTLLYDALPLLNLDKVILDVQQTYEMMHCLEEIQRDGELTKKVKDLNKFSFYMNLI